MRKQLEKNLADVRSRIEAACARADRDPSGVKLVAVTKSAPFEAIRHLVDLGVTDLGENRVQELAFRGERMKSELQQKTANAPGAKLVCPRWHMIGHLQRNKVRAVLPWAELIHSVDSLRLAEEIDEQSRRLSQVTPVLLEVNASGEGSKFGVAVAAATHLIEQMESLENLRVCGLMSMAPFTDDETVIRRTFERVQELFEEVITERICGPAFRELSLGMSNDFEIAIEYGATIVRVGSGLFQGIDCSNESSAEEADASTIKSAS